MITTEPLPMLAAQVGFAKAVERFVLAGAPAIAREELRS